MVGNGMVEFTGAIGSLGKSVNGDRSRNGSGMAVNGTEEALLLAAGGLTAGTNSGSSSAEVIDFSRSTIGPSRKITSHDLMKECEVES